MVTNTYSIWFKYNDQVLKNIFFSCFFFILWNCPLFILFAAKISSHVSTIVSDIVVALKKIYNIVWKVANRKMHFDVVLPINYNLKNHLAKWLKKVFFFFLDLFEYSWANKKFCLRQFRQSTQSYWLLYAIEFYLIWPSVANSTHLISKWLLKIKNERILKYPKFYYWKSPYFQGWKHWLYYALCTIFGTKSYLQTHFAYFGTPLFSQIEVALNLKYIVST